MIWDGEIYCPNTDVCAHCGDSECGGVTCIASLDPDNDEDREAIEQLHAWIRRGRLMEQLEHALSHAENRRCECWPPAESRPTAPQHDHNPLNSDFHGGICRACEEDQ